MTTSYIIVDNYTLTYYGKSISLFEESFIRRNNIQCKYINVSVL